MTPVIVGGVQRMEKGEERKCTACLKVTSYTGREVHGGMEMMLCIDFVNCNRRSGVLSR